MHTSAPADATPVGSTIGGKYRVVRLLGYGGMGAVYEAENGWTGRRVAVKVLRPEYTYNEEFARRFMLEGRQAARIDHPNVVDVLDMGQDPANGSLYIVQELLTGGDLRTRLSREKRLAPPEAFALIVPVMHALAAAHDAGVLHRDVKPENIFLATATGAAVVPKLIDFGISKPLAGAPESGVNFTAAGFAMGTARYMSPEQARGDVQLDARSDLWAIATVLYEALCGRPPFVAATDTLLLSKLLTESPPRIELFAPEIPRELADVLHRALAPDRALRYASVREFIAALQGCACLRADAPALYAPVAPAALADEPTEVDAGRAQHSDVHPSAAARRAAAAAGSTAQLPAPAAAPPAFAPTTVGTGWDAPTAPRGTRPLVWVALVALALAGVTAAVLVAVRVGGAHESRAHAAATPSPATPGAPATMGTGTNAIGGTAPTASAANPPGATTSSTNTAPATGAPGTQPIGGAAAGVRHNGGTTPPGGRAIRVRNGGRGLLPIDPRYPHP